LSTFHNFSYEKYGKVYSFRKKLGEGGRTEAVLLENSTKLIPIAINVKEFAIPMGFTLYK
jgi:hypothetical protein